MGGRKVMWMSELKEETQRRGEEDWFGGHDC